MAIQIKAFGKGGCKCFNKKFPAATIDGKRPINNSEKQLMYIEKLVFLSKTAEGMVLSKYSEIACKTISVSMAAQINKVA